MDVLVSPTLSKGSTTILESPSATDLTLLPSQHERKNSKTIKRRHSFHASPSPSSTIIPLPPMSTPPLNQFNSLDDTSDETIGNASTVKKIESVESNSKDEAVKEDFVGSTSNLEQDYFSLVEGGSTGVTLSPQGTINYDERRLGKCKFFSAQKGFGFIVDDRNEDIEGSEVFVHYSAIDSSCNAGRGFRSLAEGEEVEYNLMHGNKGWQAHAVSGPGGTPVIGSPPILGHTNTRNSGIHDQDGQKQKFGNRYMNYSNYSSNGGGAITGSYNEEAENFSNGVSDSAYFGSPNESPNTSNVLTSQKGPSTPTSQIPTRASVPHYSPQYQQQQQSPTQVAEYPYQQYHSELSPPQSVSPPLLPFPPEHQHATSAGSVELTNGPIEYPFYPHQNQPTRSSHSPQRVQAPYPHPQQGHYLSQSSPQSPPSSSTFQHSNFQGYSPQQQHQISQSMNFQQPRQQFYQSNPRSYHKNSYSSGNNNNNNHNNNHNGNHARRPSSFYNNQHNNNNPPPPHQIQYYSNYSNQYLLHQQQAQYQQAQQLQQQQYYGYYSNSPPLTDYSNVAQSFELGPLMSGLELETIPSEAVGEGIELVVLEG